MKPCSTEGGGVIFSICINVKEAEICESNSSIVAFWENQKKKKKDCFTNRNILLGQCIMGNICKLQQICEYIRGSLMHRRSGSQSVCNLLQCMKLLSTSKCLRDCSPRMLHPWVLTGVLTHAKYYASFFLRQPICSAIDPTKTELHILENLLYKLDWTDTSPANQNHLNEAPGLEKDKHSDCKSQLWEDDVIWMWHKTLKCWWTTK